MYDGDGFLGFWSRTLESIDYYTVVPILGSQQWSAYEVIC